MSKTHIWKRSPWLATIVAVILLIGGAFISAYNLWPFAQRDSPVSYTGMNTFGGLQLGAVAFGACTSYYSGGSYEGYCSATTPVIRAHTFALARDESRVFNFTINVGSQSCSFLIELPK
jgi:hypothetical protein